MLHNSRALTLIFSRSLSFSRVRQKTSFSEFAHRSLTSLALLLLFYGGWGTENSASVYTSMTDQNSHIIRTFFRLSPDLCFGFWFSQLIAHQITDFPVIIC